ncbi:OmpA family protein [Pseudomonas aeruginosa]
MAVEDAVDRSVVTIRGDELFASASASVRDEFQPLLLRIADALRKVKGQVLVTGHSDNRPIATLRYPSNWKLSQARAPGRSPTCSARPPADAGRFTAEGRGDTEPVASNASAEAAHATAGWKSPYSRRARNEDFLNFFARWVVPVLGLLALSLIIWFLGPLLRRWATTDRWPRRPAAGC